MKEYRIKVEGITPYMQHRMDDISLAEWEKLRKNIIERPEVSQTDARRAEYHCYRNTDGQCYIPSEHFRQSIINAGSFIKSKVGVRSKSMTTIVAALFIITPEEILISNYDSIDKRSAVNRNVKARVITVRPKWKCWKCEFTLECDEDTITMQTIEQLFSYAGKYIGIGSYRPEKRGLFGRFKVVSIDLK
jgi:hypothetical protein